MGSLVQQLVDHHGGTPASSIAIMCPRRGALTYETIARESNQLARYLIDAGLGRQDRCVIWLSRDSQYVLAMLAVLKADAVYVPLDDQSPPERNAKIVSHCRPRVILCDADTVGAVIEACSSLELPPRLIRVGTAPRAPNDIDAAVVDAIIEGYTNGDLEYSNIDEDLAQIIYTSGSSGHPKGVMITHRSLADYITWGIEYFALGPEQRVLSTAPFHFDMSTFDIYCPLGAGAMLSIASREQVIFPAALAKRIAAEGVTHWKAAASLFTLFARAGLVGHRSLRSLRHVAFSGERAPTKYVAEWMKAYPETTFYNGYGPTEATGVSVVQRIEHVPNSPDEDVPIGRACANTEVALFDDSAGPVPRGAQGEIWIRGSCLSAGYWRDLKLTAEHFVIRKDDAGLSSRWYRSGDIGYVDEEGLLHFVGRLDDQVKHLGYRIELEEVNRAISTLRCVADSAVMLLSSRAKGVDTIVAFVELCESGTVAQVSRSLVTTLPSYMIPAVIKSVPAIPRTERGKVDRDDLRRIWDHASGTTSKARV